MENIVYAPNEMESFKERLAYNNLELQVVLYFEHRFFEFDPKNFMIRPSTSILWYPADYFNPNKLNHLRRVLLDRYNKVCNGNFTRLKYEGLKSDKTIIIELEDFYSKIKDDEDIAQEHNLFMYELISLYSQWENVLNSVEI